MDGILLTLPILGAATTESISGTVLDPSAATTPGPHADATNTATGVERATTTNDKGFFAFPSLPAGRYEFKVDREGFSPPRLTILVVDDHSALQTDTTLPMIEKIERASVAIAPSGILNPRSQSISGRRQDAQDWSISGIARASTGVAVPISSDGDNSLMGSVANGVNNHSLDLPGYTPGSLNLNSNPQNARLYFNRSLFRPDALRTAGTPSRRSFHGPGMVKIVEAEALGSARILLHLQPRSGSWTGDGRWRYRQQTFG